MRLHPGNSRRGLKIGRSAQVTSRKVASFQVLDSFWALVSGAPLWSLVMDLVTFKPLGSTTWITCENAPFSDCSTSSSSILLGLYPLNVARDFAKSKSAARSHLVCEDVEHAVRLYRLENFITCTIRNRCISRLSWKQRMHDCLSHQNRSLASTRLG